MYHPISHQKATAIARKYFHGEMPKHDDGYCLPSGAKLRKSPEHGWVIVCYTYNPDHLELKPLGIIRN